MYTGVEFANISVKDCPTLKYLLNSIMLQNTSSRVDGPLKKEAELMLGALTLAEPILVVCVTGLTSIDSKPRGVCYGMLFLIIGYSTTGCAAHS